MATRRIDQYDRAEVYAFRRVVEVFLLIGNSVVIVGVGMIRRIAVDYYLISLYAHCDG